MQANLILGGRQACLQQRHGRQHAPHVTLAHNSAVTAQAAQQSAGLTSNHTGAGDAAPSGSSRAALDSRPGSSSSRSSSSPYRSRLAGGVGAGALLLPPDGIVTAALMNTVVGAQPDAADESYLTHNRVAYQGVPGAYSESAALKACPGWDPLPCEQFEVAFQALSQWMAERAVLPVENSLGGSIHAVYDLLLRYRLHIVGEVSVAVNHCLMALPGTKKSDLVRVMSHPQALAQVDGYLRRMPGVVREAVDDTAGAAKTIAEQSLINVGAVASRRAAELYGLEVLEEGIQDMSDNITRFVVLSRDPLVTSGQEGQRFKTSIVFSLQEGPGQLFKAMSVFALRDINMTKIESRPMRANPIIVSSEGGNGAAGRAFNYLFYVDFVGSLSDPQAQNALRHLQEIAPFLRVLGSYPADTEL